MATLVGSALAAAVAVVATGGLLYGLDRWRNRRAQRCPACAGGTHEHSPSTGACVTSRCTCTRRTSA